MILKSNKSLVIRISVCILAVLLFSTQVSAAGPIDLNQPATLTISYRDGDQPIVGAQFGVFQIAAVDAYGELTALEPYAHLDVQIRGENDEAWKNLTAQAELEILTNQIAPDTHGVTDEQGLLTFTGLPHGVYLVMGLRHAQNGMIYETESFLVMLPGMDLENNVWNYDVVANTKHSSRPDTDGKVSRKVLKVWEDEGYENLRPTQIEVMLLRDGEIYETVIITPDEDGNWSYTWENLDADYEWTVVEKVIEGYIPEIDQEGITFVITNRYGKTPPPPPPPPDLPQTGQLWWPVPALLFLGLTLVVFGLIRRRGAAGEA